MKGKFIVFEGIDGSGKTTQLKLLKSRLDATGQVSVEHAEPTGGVIGRFIRSVLSCENSVQPDTLALLFAADRREHIDEVVRELDAGKHVVCDRYIHSSLAFQSLDLPFDTVYGFNKLNYELLMPDIVVFVDTPPEICISRINQSRETIELFETSEKLKRIRVNYDTAFTYVDSRTTVVTVDGADNVEAVENAVWKAVMRVI